MNHEHALRFAEDLTDEGTPWPGSEFVRVDGSVIWFAPKYYPGLAVVRSVRLRDDNVDEAVESARQLAKERGFHRLVWTLGPSASPDDLHERLLAAAFKQDAEPALKAMVLTRPPEGLPGEVEVRRAETRDDMRTFFRIQQKVYHLGPAEIELRMRYIDEVAEADLASEHTATYIAYVDDRAVATARATFTDHGVILNGGATLQEARGRGCYRALVGARWDDAVERGTPCLATHAGSMSHPVLLNMGFEDVCDVRVFIDEF